MLTVHDLYDLSHSLAGAYLKQFTYPWEALAGISDWILEIGRHLPEEEYVHPKDWDELAHTVIAQSKKALLCLRR